MLYFSPQSLEKVAPKYYNYRFYNYDFTLQTSHAHAQAHARGAEDTVGEFGSVRLVIYHFLTLKPPGGDRLRKSSTENGLAC
jgi:hypothetical protein